MFANLKKNRKILYELKPHGQEGSMLPEFNLIILKEKPST